MQIRYATEKGLDAVARVRARIMVASDYYEGAVDVESEYRRVHPRAAGYFEGTYHPRCSLAERTVIVAEHNDQIVGFIAGHRSTRMGCTGELRWMFVLPNWQRKGIGADLLRPLAKWFTEQESTKVIVDAPPENPFRDFYLKHGAIPLDEYWPLRRAEWDLG
jgi:GNAT superfamily N-acetyltransferase